MSDSKTDLYPAPEPAPEPAAPGRTGWIVALVLAGAWFGYLYVFGPGRRFLAGKDWPMTFLHERGDRLPPVFTTNGIPATFVIAPDGQVAAATIGSARWDDPSVVEFLKSLDTAKPVPAAAGEGRFP